MMNCRTGVSPFVLLVTQFPRRIDRLRGGRCRRGRRRRRRRHHGKDIGSYLLGLLLDLAARLLL